MKKISLIMFIAVIILTAILTSCTDADVVSRNISKSADQFEVYRRVVFYNGITNEYILIVEGFCSIGVDSVDNQLELTVKTSENTYLKHFLGLSDNVTYFAEQLQDIDASNAHYRVIFKPSTIIPDIDFE